MRPAFAPLSLALLSLALPASAQPDFSTVDLRPLVHVQSTIDQLAGFPPPVRTLVDRDVFITRGGAMTSLTAQRSEGSFFFQRMVRGIGRPETVSALLQAFSAGRIGQQNDCRLPLPEETFGLWAEVTWYGRLGRRNRFLVVYTNAAYHPLCPPEIEEILGAVGDFESRVGLLPDTEILTSR